MPADPHPMLWIFGPTVNTALFLILPAFLIDISNLSPHQLFMSTMGSDKKFQNAKKKFGRKNIKLLSSSIIDPKNKWSQEGGKKILNNKNLNTLIFSFSFSFFLTFNFLKLSRIKYIQNYEKKIARKILFYIF